MNRLNIKTKWWALCLVAFLSVVTPILPYFMLHASAITTSSGGGGSSFDPSVNQHIDRSTILYNQVYYFDSQIDDNYTYEAQGQGVCDANHTEHIGNGTLRDGNKKATLFTYAKDPATGACKETKTDITLAYPERAVMPFTIINDSTIITSDKKVTYKLDPSRGEYLEQGGDRCKDIIKITNGPDYQGASLTVLSSSTKDHRTGSNYGLWDAQVAFDYSHPHNNSGCHTYGPQPFKASAVYLNSANVLPQGSPAAAIMAAAQGSSGSGTDGNTTPSCEGSTNGWSLSWIFCPLIEGISKTVDSIYTGIIQPQLVTKPVIISRGSEDPSKIYDIWQSFRVYGDVILVLALLVIVFGQAIGGGLVDAYTAKKVLPRLLVAVILINLSIYIVAFMVDITNIIGGGIASLIEAPFKVNGAYELHFSGSSSAIGVGAAIIGAGVLLGVGAIYGVMVLTFLLPVFILFLAILVTVLLRNGLIIFLIYISPVAFALYCLPNTEKYFRKWWELLLKTLIVYPIIAILFAMGNVLSITINAAGGTGSAFLSIVAFMVPLFAIPFAFKFAGGALGAAHGLVHDRARGISSRVAKRRQATAADRFKRAQSNSLWDNNSAIGKRANKVAGWATAPVDNAAYYGRNTIPGLKKRGHRIASSIEHAGVEQSTKLFEELNKSGYNDRAYRALSGQHGDLSASTQTALKDKGLFGTAPKSLSQIKDVAEIMAHSDNYTERIGGQAMEGSLGRLATLYQDQEMTKASVGAAGILGLAAHGFATSGDLAGAGNQLIKTGGTAFAQSVVSQAQMLGARSRPDNKAGYGIGIDKDGQFFDGINGRKDAAGNIISEKRDLDLISTLSQQDVAGAKGGFLKDLRGSYQEIFAADDARAASYNANVEQVKARAKSGVQQVAGMSKEDYTRAQDAAAKAAEAQFANSNAPDARNAKAASMKQATRDQLLSWAGPYSQASTDVKTQSLKMIDDFSGGRGPDGKYARGTMGYELENMLQSRNLSPEERTRMGLRPDEER